jgi:2-dehydropantoate 2-reductase
MRIGIVGAGAIGGFIAAALANARVPVGIVARGPHLAAIRRDGIRVRSDLGEFAVRLEAADDLRALGDFDVLLLTFKAHQWPAFLPQLEPFARRGASVVTMQNGLPFWFVREPPLHSVDPGGRIGRSFSDERTIGGVVHVSGTITAPGEIRQSGGLRYVLGDPRGAENDRLRALADVFSSAGLEPEIDPKIRTTVWLKLVNNAGLNPMSVISGMSVKPMLADHNVRSRVRELMIEALEVGRAIGVVGDVNVDERIAYAARLDDVRTSMLQDFELGRSLEIDPILGAIVELAQRHGVAVPLLESTYAELRSRTALRPST